MERENRDLILRLIKGVGLALAISIVAAMLFAVILRLCNLPDKVVYPINQTLKGIAICVGVLTFVQGEKGFLQGMGIALLFCITSYLLFGVIGGDFSLSAWTVVELLSSLLLGTVGGAIAVNLKKSG